jgi:hypothetical protein
VTTTQIIMSIVGSAVLLIGYLLAQRGKRGDQEIQQTKDQFQRMVDEAKYWKTEAEGARDDLENFRDRQLSRCRKVTESAYATISDLIRFVPDEMRRRADHALDEIEQHKATDHSE